MPEKFCYLAPAPRLWRQTTNEHGRTFAPYMHKVNNVCVTPANARAYSFPSDTKISWLQQGTSSPTDRPPAKRSRTHAGQWARRDRRVERRLLAEAPRNVCTIYPTKVCRPRVSQATSWANYNVAELRKRRACNQAPSIAKAPATGANVRPPGPSILKTAKPCMGTSVWRGGGDVCPKAGMAEAPPPFQL